MRLVALIALFIGLALAGGAVYFASLRFQTLETRLAELRARPQVELVDVAVALKNLRYGDILTPDAVAMTPWPKAALPPNAFTTVEALFGTPGAAPRSILRTMDPGEAILTTKVTEFGEPAGIAQRLAEGKRAYTIRVDVTSGVSGFLRVDDRVDVFWSGNDSGRPLTKLLLESMPLIAIDQQADEERGRATVARTVTLEVDPPQVALLAQAAATGRLSLSLRGTRDDTAFGAVEVDQATVIGIVAPEPEEPAEPPSTVNIRRGTDVEIVPLP